jgi:hypothetical protein
MKYIITNQDILVAMLPVDVFAPTSLIVIADLVSP